MNQSIFSETIYLITGVAGFIGFHLTKKLLHSYPGLRVIGIDNMNNYYDIRLKEVRLQELLKFNTFTFIKGDVADKNTINETFETYRPNIVINLAAQAGVRHSITHPDAYIESNIIGFYNILEAVRHSYNNGENGVGHLISASSSSVYGNNSKVPYSTEDQTDMPVSLYAATKKSNELMAYAYSKLYNIPFTGLRFFTVYGPNGRPDMAYFKFSDNLIKGKKIQIYNYGNNKRDFTYIDDVVDCVCRIIRKPPECKSNENGITIAPYAVYNIGNSHPESMLKFINILQQELIRVGLLPANFNINEYIEFVAMQPGDVQITYADVSALERNFGFKPSTTLQAGLRKFAEWYKSYMYSS